ncbi:MAG: enoyl-CoA hydratase-related protein [Actinomycetota bacterium]
MSDVVTELHGSVLCIKLNRPEKKNALTFAMYDAFSDALESAAADSTIRADVITVSGDSFCAGNDLKDFLAGSVKIDGPSPQARLIANFVKFPKPFIAAVNGITVGIGVTMLLHCDLVYASPLARFKTGFTDLGVVPEAGSTRLLAQRVGALNASQLFLLGDLVSASEAHHLGLINGVIEDDVVSVALSKAAQIAAKSPDAVCTTKALLRSDQGTLDDVIRRENVEFSRLLASDDFKAAASKLVK